MEDKSGEEEGEDGVEISQKKSHQDMNLADIWTQYTEENDQNYFRRYIKGFISNWENMPNNCRLTENWNVLVQSCLKENVGCGRCCGPSLSDLPDELLAALSKFLFVGKDQIESEGTVEVESVINMREITTCLTILICQNYENIPLVGSMAFVAQLTQTCSLLLSHLLQMESSFFTSGSKASSVSTARRIKPTEGKDTGKKIGKNSNSSLRNEIVSFIIASCHFLEAMYDPAFRWRAYLSKTSDKSQSISIEVAECCPILLHQETIPFLYESFETALVDSFPDLAIEMLNVFGAVISGSRHNAIRAISPATTKMILKTLQKDKQIAEEKDIHGQSVEDYEAEKGTWSTNTGKKSKKQNLQHHRESKKDKDIPVKLIQAAEELYITSIYCSAKSIQVLHETPTHERQLDIVTVIEQYQQILRSLTEKEFISLPVLVKGVGVLSNIIHVENDTEVKKLLAKSDLIDTLLMLVKECRISSDSKRTLLHVVINTVTLLLKECPAACDRMTQKKGYDNLFDIINRMTPGPDSSTLHSLLLMSTHGEDPTDGRKAILSVKPISYLIQWITQTDCENVVQQNWLIKSLNELCCANHQNKMLCCQSGVMVKLITALKESYRKLDPRSAMEILKMIECLGHHSISPYELKQLISLLQDEEEGNGSSQQQSQAFVSKRKFPYKSHVIHVISSIARGSGFETCRHYFDIPLGSAGLTVPNIRQW